MNDDSDSVFPVGKKYRLLITLIAFIVLLSMGSLTVSSVETPHIRHLTKQYRRALHNFLINNTCVLEDDLDELIDFATLISGHGLSPLKDANNDYIWSFGDGIFFMVVYLLTIGYGHVTLIDDFSKAFLVVYGVFGIPFTLFVLNLLVLEMSKASKYLLSKLNGHLGRVYQPFKIRMIHFGFMCSIVAFLVLIIPTIVFTTLEPQWSYLDSVYYIFVSLTTIGLGDFVPSDGVEKSHMSFYRIAVTVYLILGMAGAMLIMTIYYDIPQLQCPRFMYIDTPPPQESDEKKHLSTAPYASYTKSNNSSPRPPPSLPPSLPTFSAFPSPLGADPLDEDFNFDDACPIYPSASESN